jgi:hypothetical protein
MKIIYEKDERTLLEQFERHFDKKFIQKGDNINEVFYRAEDIKKFCVEFIKNIK